MVKAEVTIDRFIKNKQWLFLLTSHQKLFLEKFLELPMLGLQLYDLERQESFQ